MRYFTLKTSGFGFLSVKGWFWPPDVLIYREDLVRTRAPATKKRPTGVDRFLFYGGPSGVQPAPQAAAASLRALRAALANAHAFTQLRALTGFDSVQGLYKRKGPLCRGPSQFKVAGKGIEPLTRGFSVLCSTN